ncbi:amidohydrolase family protein [Roseomonas sp. BN140053]|uniref:amidohydrolase family protein n=1 Tax=Roseomonas sp. BN140053 TaxID=3391898 RepID=UPI0039EBC9A4
MPAPPPGAIDCDVHPAVPGTAALLPYLDEQWADTVRMVLRGIGQLELNSYPPNAPLSARPDWRPAEGRAGSSLEQLREQLLDRFAPRLAICNPLFGGQVLFHEYLAAALCRAVNDWLAREWLDREPRLRGSITVSTVNPELAAEEIERLAGDRRFVQVLLLVGNELPLGRRAHWPIFRAAERHGLPVGVHAGSMFRHPPTQSGYPSSLVEDYVLQSQVFASQLASLVAEGVFTKFPALKVVLIESGVTWLPGFLWRFNKDWRGVRTEVPWVHGSPAEVVREHVRLTIQPLDGPPDPGALERLMEHFRSDEMFLFSTDYPHWQFDGDAALPPGLPATLLHKLLVDNALDTFPRLKEATP